MTITEKRAELYKEWRLAIYANDGDYYNATLALGIPDGDTPETVLEDLQEGFYDDDIMETIGLYKWAKKRYSGGGWYFTFDLLVIEDEAEALKHIEEVEGKLPARIYKNKVQY